MIEIREIGTVAEAEAAAGYLQSVWADGPEVVPVDLIIAGAHVGAYAVAAYEGEKVVGASFGIQGSFNGARILHSHVTAVAVKGLGFDIKQHQREWAAKQGIKAITWTFDPLVRRNCVFNFEKLGATAIEYLPNFYGAMSDAINQGEESDRLFAWWDVESEYSSEGTEIARIELPEDIEVLRQTDPVAAQNWRKDVRNQLSGLFAEGAVISKMSPDRKSLIVTK